MTASVHRLRLGLHGYLIRFAPLAYVPERQSVPADCFRLWRSVEYQRISPLLSTFHQPLPLSSLIVSQAFPWLSQDL